MRSKLLKQSRRALSNIQLHSGQKCKPKIDANKLYESLATNMRFGLLKTKESHQPKSSKSQTTAAGNARIRQDALQQDYILRLKDL